MQGSRSQSYGLVQQSSRFYWLTKPILSHKARIRAHHQVLLDNNLDIILQADRASEAGSADPWPCHALQRSQAAAQEKFPSNVRFTPRGLPAIYELR